MKNWRPLLALVLVAAMIVVMQVQGKALVTPVSRRGIIDVEFAATAERWQQLMLFLNYEALTRNLQLDFLFIFSYVFFFVSTLKFFQDRNGWTVWPPRFITMGIAAGFFDIAENFLLTMLVNGRFDTGVLPVVAVIAAVKFLLAILVLLYILRCSISLFGKGGRLLGGEA
jgi:hypothetical protein